jgi:hypothetical protein
MKNLLLTVSILLVLCACTDPEGEKKLFTRLSKNRTGVDFRNMLQEEHVEFNILHYPYFYNGGGVAIGDINNDSLPDLFFTGNMVKNRLFLNKGNLEFENITTKAGIAEKEGWCTGVTMVDINQDGWLDIYVCRSALSNVSLRKNLLFINNHDLTFSEQAAKYGLDNAGYSTQASFFDYDKDGDLDMFLINQSTPEYSRGKIEYIQLRSQKADTTLENKLYRNDNGKFVNVTSQSGITSNVLSFSLGISTSDINQDGWPDIYVANDFKEPDYLYINNHDGTFTNKLTQAIDHNSLYSMGIDVADYNNDMLPDIIVLDMLAEKNHAQKMHMGGDNYTQYSHLFRNGMFYQYMKNTLQKNNGDGTFSEVAQLSGVSNTDWSWSPLLADFDNDGLKDLFISNGYKRDNTDIQFIIYSMNESLRIQKGGDAVNIADYISHMPGILLPNYIYKNTGNDHFENKIKEWGFDHNTFTNGAVYADLDNDGDLDLVTNNVEDFAGIYQNNSERLSKNNYIKIKLNGKKENPIGIGAKVYAFAGNDSYYLEQNPTRGYQSSVYGELHLGLGDHKTVDSLRIVWPDNSTQLIKSISANKTILLDSRNASGNFDYSKQNQPPLQETHAIEFIHHENYENDFLKQFLLPHFYSHNGPSLAKGDVNGDHLEDLFIGGAKDQTSALFLNSSKENFTIQKAGLNTKGSEVTDAVLFDADGDKDLDLYTVSGGYEFQIDDQLLQDHLFTNNGKGVFTEIVLPTNRSNKTCVRVADIDHDSDIDLFIGGGVAPGNYPSASPSKIYVNDGHGKFSDQSQKYFKNITLNIINDAAWIDLNKDDQLDLVTVGEWEPIRAFINIGNSFTEETRKYFPFSSNGWWNTIKLEDMDKDGDADLIVGNFGLNSQLHATEAQPLQLFATDIDGNGSIDPVITHYIDGVSYPMVPRDDMIGQVPSLKKKFIDYGVYANATINDIIPNEKLDKIVPMTVQTLQTVYLENQGDHFKAKQLPIEAQYAPVYAIHTTDINKDGNLDLILAGNNKYNRIYLGNCNANHGVLLLGDGKGNFKYAKQNESGLNLRGDVRDVTQIGNTIIFGINDSSVKSMKISAK